MKLRADLARYSLFVVLLALTGCDGSIGKFVNTQSPQESMKTGREPIAVVSIAPTEQWLDAFKDLAGGCDEQQPLDIEQVVKQLPSIDLQQPVTLLFYPSKRRTILPVVYVPVVDYEKFMSGLAKRVHLNRAVASSFMVGTQKVFIKQRDNFAVFGTSIKDINSAPGSPTTICKQLPKDAHFALKIKTESLRESDKQKLAVFLGNFGQTIESIALESESIVLALNFDAESGIKLQTQVYPEPENLDELRQSLHKSIAGFEIPVSSENVDDKLVFTVDLTAGDIAATCSKFGESLVDSLRSQQRVVGQQVSSGYRAPLPKITYMNSGFNASSSESSCSGGTQRRGGG